MCSPSALSRLVKNVERAQKTITREFSLDEEASALSRLRRELTGLLKTQDEQTRKFQEEVLSALKAMTARREESDRSTRHGLVFEQAVCEMIEAEPQRAGDIATATGNTTGQIRNCKVGDAVWELGPESAAPEARPESLSGRRRERRIAPIARSFWEAASPVWQPTAAVPVGCTSQRRASDSDAPTAPQRREAVALPRSRFLEHRQVQPTAATRGPVPSG